MQAKYGTGTITKKNGKWVWVGHYKDDTGKIKRPTKTFKTEKEAMLFQAEQVSKTQIKKEMQTMFKYYHDLNKIAGLKIIEATENR